jgi:predicted lipoprotein with Yx(FWY)xxD motif
MHHRIGWTRGALIVPLAVAALVVAAACTSSGAGGAASAAPTVATAVDGGVSDYGRAPETAAPAAGASEVKTATDAALGTFLVDEGGRTLYIFTKDTKDTSVCSGDCATSWPPFTVAAGESAKAGAGVSGTLATIARADGGTQVTYDGAPLYYFAGDARAGDTTGQGVGGVWFVAAP